MRVLRLIGVELDRLASRRLTLVAVLVLVGILGLLQLAVNQELSAAGPAGIAEQRQAYERAAEDWDAHHVEREAACRADGGDEEECAEPRPTEEDFALDPPTFAEVVDPILQSVAYLGGITVFLIAASFIGAEFTSGAIGNWLIFVPRRGEVYAAKLIAVAVGAAVVSGGLGLLTLGAAVGFAAFHQVPVSDLGMSVATVGRAGAAAVVLAAIGFVVALLGRHTVVALGVFVAYAVLAFVRGVVFSFEPWAQQLTPLTPEINLEALVADGATYYVGAEGQIQRTVSGGAGGLYLTVLAAAFAVVGWLVFRRRDVN